MEIQRYPECFGNPRFSDADAELINRAIPVFHEVLALRREYPVKENSTMTSLTISCRENVFPYINHGYHTYYSFIESLAHEFVHAKQYDEGRLWVEEGKSFLEPSIFVYEDQRFPDGANLIRDSAPILEKYMAIPWEVEPYAYMTELAERVLRILEVEYEEAQIVVQGVNLRVLRIAGATNPDISPEALDKLYRPKPLSWDYFEWKTPVDTKPLSYDGYPNDEWAKKTLFRPEKPVKKVDMRHWVQEKRNKNWKFVA